MTEREQLLYEWSTSKVSGEKPADKLQIVSGDASFRHYFRLKTAQTSYIAVDAPPAQEDSRPFVAIAKALIAMGLNVPKIHAADFEHGFMLLSDLGDDQYLGQLNPQTCEQLYHQAIDKLLIMQTCNEVPGMDIPEYHGQLLLNEMQLFPDWLLKTHLQLELSPTEQQLIKNTFDKIHDKALAQPRVFVHRDYHSRNLMLTSDNNPGIIDFQDAVIGPITYDLVSLLRDCYIAWSPEKISNWVAYYRKNALQAGILSADISEEIFIEWFDWMGIQRHLKAAGIFARLKHRDGKDGYLCDIPRTVNYILSVGAQYQELEEFISMIKEKTSPLMQNYIASETA